MSMYHTKWRCRSRGAALVITMMLTLILSMLGMAVVSYSAIEEEIAVSWRDRIEVSQIAEAGVRIAQQMFLTPEDAELVPVFGGHFTSESELNGIGVFRTMRGDIGSHYTGTDDRLFRGPFRSEWNRVFGGTREPGSDQYDLRFSCSRPDGTPVPPNDCWLETNLNPLVTEAMRVPRGRITEISFYGPPIVDGRRYGYATVRVTAQKLDARNRLAASETLEAIIGENAPQPSILSNGNLTVETSRFCGTCERVHANGNIDAISGSSFRGGSPPLSATGTIAAGSSSVDPPPRERVRRIEPPAINPWDLLYRPVSPESLSKYFLLTTRTPANEWTDNDPDTGSPPRPCGRSLCQDYGLEFSEAGASRPPRSATGQGRLYRWNESNQNWDLVQETSDTEVPRTAKLELGTTGERPRFEVWPFDDQLLPGVGDDAELPFDTERLPITFFRLEDPIFPVSGEDWQGVTLLVDGALWIDAPVGGNRLSGDAAWKASIIAVGSVYISGNLTVDPALPNRVLLISGRDIHIDGSFNGDLYEDCCSVAPRFVTPPPDGVVAAASGVIAAHEQILIAGGAALLGVVIAENAIDLDRDRTTGGFRSLPSAVLGNAALHISANSRHIRVCNHPVWPWPDSGGATVLSMRRD